MGNKKINSLYTILNSGKIYFRNSKVFKKMSTRRHSEPAGT